MHVVYPSVEDVAGAMLGRGGGVPIYAGSLSQKGYGIGGYLKGFVSMLKPLLFATGKKALAKGALGFASDAVNGVPITESLKRQAMNQGKDILSSALHTAGQSVIDQRLPPALRQKGKGSIMRAPMSSAAIHNTRKRAHRGGMKTGCRKIRRVSRGVSVFR